LYALLLPVLAVAAVVMVTGAAQAATLKEHEGEVFLAIYGYPGESSTSPAEERPIGGGLGRNFGFGENMLFRANHAALAETENLAITIGGTVLEAKDSYLGGTLMSNTTGANNPLSFTIDFSDFQDSFAGATAAPAYSDTTDREWIAEICSPAAARGNCKVDPIAGTAAGEGAEPGEVKIENVSFNVFISKKPNVIQGTVWGTWLNSSAAGKPPCIELHAPPANKAALTSQTLYGTQGTVLGLAITAIKGKACLISANNNWYKASSTEEKTPLIEIANS